MEARKLELESLEDRLAFMSFDAKARGVLRDVKPVVEASLETALDRFYQAVRQNPELRDFFKDDAHMDQAKDLQMTHWQSILDAQFDDSYHQKVRTVGLTHARIGLKPKWYMGAYALVIEEVVKTIVRSQGSGVSFLRGGASSAETVEKVVAVVKAALLDIELSVSVYFEDLEERWLARQESLDFSLDQLAIALEKLADGDLDIQVNAEDFAGKERLASAMNLAVSNLREIISETRTSADSIRAGSNEIAQASDDLARRTEQQAASVEETTASINSLNEKVKDTAETARKTDATVGAALKDAQAGGEVVKETQSAMAQIENSSREMSQIISVIDEIAFQTNLLALNAGVEAARAGEAGKGFAVVASEVRTLAQRSAEAAKSIKSLISSSSEHVGAGVNLVENTSEVLTRTIEAFGEVSGQVNGMAAAAEAQATSIGEINSAIEYLDQMTQQNAAMVEETSAAGASLSNEADNMSGLVARFQLNE
ncbi:Methyl-accepting chemotaxis protein [Candidatus Rhodobacter oscarellae]|uniref:Methyl-accepting chemotaxis protein n=1 Tax=Candidatus Rhodobacter oscarellae TaxID=1675527 RepID=A0A0J9EG78_9RHOB|nr:globin-coupled sensor protein [Candidatus Rhodobacter lobularis]KMW60669.1 Methyl-accepting chemotaxis protein [Candidatus Rhodobacter lobularis]